jgi:ferrous iron transport protein B
MAADPIAAASSGRCVAVAGNPNSGKTTLFNALTGLRMKVANYPGVTVERREGRLSWNGTTVNLLDLPGTYSLSAQALDEQIARDALLGRVRGVRPPDGVLIVIDASNLERNLYFASQVLDLGLPAVVACNMMDVVERRGDRLDIDSLSAELGVPVVATVASRGLGISDLRAAVATRALLHDQCHAADRKRPWRMPEPVEQSVQRIADLLRERRCAPPETTSGLALLLLMDAASSFGDERHNDGLPADVRSAVGDEIRRLREVGIEDVAAIAVEARYAWIAAVVRRVLHRRTETDHLDTLSDRIDRVLTHRFWGIAAFATLMFLVFASIFWWAEPFMRLIESGQGWLQGFVRGLLPAGPLVDLLADGVIAGVGAVVIFFPQICILFLFIAILEDSGYMARAAFLMDRLMSRVGLHGKSFIPLLSSYACAVPGIMATRTIENPRDRLTTILVAPLMSCSARLPVYLIVIAAVFGSGVWLKAGVIVAMYAVGTVTALLMAGLLKKTLLRGPRPVFIMELPPYHAPRPWIILRTMWDRSKLFLTRAGTVILAICIVLWALAYFPRDEQALTNARERSLAALRAAGLDESALDGPRDALTTEARDALQEIDDERAGEQLRNSYLGEIGRGIEPLIEPLGFDWKIGIGLAASFAAREVFVGTMGVVYNVGQGDEESSPLRDRLRAATWESGPRAGRPIFTPLVGVSLMVFYVLCCQCISTLAVARRETNSWRWPVFMFVYMTLLAYLASLAIYQIGARLGLGS